MVVDAPVVVVVDGAAVVTGVDAAVVTVVAGVVGVVTVVTVVVTTVTVVGAAVVVTGATVTVELAFKPEVRPAEATLVGEAVLFNQQALTVLTKVQDWQFG